MNKTQLSQALLSAAKDGKIEEVKDLLAAGANPRVDRSGALRGAAKAGHLDIVRLLIPLSNVVLSDALGLAGYNGRLDVVRELIPYSKPKLKKSLALRLCVIQGHVDCVRELIPVSNPRDRNSGTPTVFLAAVLNGHVTCVRELLPFVDALEDKINALNYAAARNDDVLRNLLVTTWAVEEWPERDLHKLGTKYDDLVLSALEKRRLSNKLPVSNVDLTTKQRRGGYL